MSLTLALHEFRNWMTRYRRTWRGTVVISVLNPLLFLVAVGLGLGQLVKSGGPYLGDVSYFAFFAPGMLAAASMQNGIVESAFGVSFARRRDGQYGVATATPLEPVDIFAGHLLYMSVRVAMSATAFIAVMWLLGAPQSWLVVLTLPAAVLLGLAFATPCAAWAVTLDNPGPVGSIFKWVVMPLYLFSGTFFAIEQLPEWLRWLAYVTPLWHGVDLCRTLSLGTATWGASAIHVAYLVVLAIAGAFVARRNYERYLHP